MYETLTNALHTISQVALVPDIVGLILLICYSVFQIGCTIVEYAKDRSKFMPDVTRILNEMNTAQEDTVSGRIAASSLLRRQKEALIELFENRHLPDDARFALAKEKVGDERAFYNNIVSRTDLVAKLGPMFGLMGTLIPLGPGIIALSTGDTQSLASALLVAFDTTVAGLIAAAICMVISRVRRKWYESYMKSFEAVMTALLEKIDLLKAGGTCVASADEGSAGDGC